MFKNTEAAMTKFLSDGIPGNDIIIFKDGKEVYRSYRGYSDIDNNIPMTGKEKYNMYSCSKPITATAAMQLVEKGDLALDEPLHTFIPEYKAMYIKNGNDTVRAKNDITIKHLLTMSAGFDYNTNSAAIKKARTATEGRCPTLETIKYLAEEPLGFEPGAKYQYSLCHDVLAAVIEVASGMRFGEYIKKNIFEPLKMNNSTFLLPDERLGELCRQYTKSSGVIRLCGDGSSPTADRKIQSYKLGSEYESGGAGLISTVDDYIKFNEAMRIGDIILKKETVSLMCTDMMENVDAPLDAMYPYSYGLGVRCRPKNGLKNVTDFGWGGAAGSFLAIDPVGGYSLFYAMHVLNFASLDGNKDILPIVKKDLKLD